MTSTAYAFRLSDDERDKPYRDWLDQRLADSGADTVSEGLRTVFRQLVDTANGAPLVQAVRVLDMSAFSDEVAQKVLYELRKVQS